MNMVDEIGRQLIFIPWKKDYQLTWTDFTGTPEDPEQKGWTYTEIQYQYRFAYVNDFPNLKFKFTKVHVGAFFNKTRSWIKDELLEQENQQLILKHEQGHFDLAEEYARKIAIAMRNAVKDKEFSCIGNSLEEQRKHADILAKQILQEIFDKYMQEWKREEDVYDIDPKVGTNHGLNVGNQEKYDRRFADLRK